MLYVIQSMRSSNYSAENLEKPEKQLVIPFHTLLLVGYSSVFGNNMVSVFYHVCIVKTSKLTCLKPNWPLTWLKPQFQFSSVLKKAFLVTQCLFSQPSCVTTGICYSHKSRRPIRHQLTCHVACQRLLLVDTLT